jgi:hypothetical protein
LEVKWPNDDFETVALLVAGCILGAALVVLWAVLR